MFGSSCALSRVQFTAVHCACSAAQMLWSCSLEILHAHDQAVGRHLRALLTIHGKFVAMGAAALVTHDHILRCISANRSLLIAGEMCLQVH